MEIGELTHEQIANLTPEQITELESNPERLDEILAQQDAGKATESEQEVKDGAANGADEETPVVLTKNGKGVIPYENHKQLRVENATLKEQLQAMQQRLDEIAQQRAEGTNTAEQDAALAEAAAGIEQRMVTLGEDMPDLHSILAVTRNELKRNADEIKVLKRAVAQAQHVTEQTLEEQVAEAKDNNPYLSHWDVNDKAAFEEAIRQDDLLRTMPEWMTKSIPERFEEVARRVQLIMPSASKPNTPESVKASVKTRLEQAPVRRPTTLSDLHGGESPKSERELAENMTAAELTKHLMNVPAHVGRAMRADLD